MRDLQARQPRELVKESNTYTPPQNLRRFVEVLLSEEVKGNKVKAESLSHVGRHIFYWHYKNKPEFRAWMSEQCDMFMAHYEPVVGFSLMGAIMKNDVMAIRTYYELAGKLKHIVKNEGALVEVRTPTIINFIAGKRDATDSDGHRVSASVSRGIEPEGSV